MHLHIKYTDRYTEAASGEYIQIIGQTSKRVARTIADANARITSKKGKQANQRH